MLDRSAVAVFCQSISLYRSVYQSISLSLSVTDNCDSTTTALGSPSFIWCNDEELDEGRTNGEASTSNSDPSINDSTSSQTDIRSACYLHHCSLIL